MEHSFACFWSPPTLLGRCVTIINAPPQNLLDSEPDLRPPITNLKAVDY